MTTMDENGNIHYTLGDTFDLHLVDIKEDDVSIDWTGWKHELKVTKQIDGEPILSLSESDGIDTSIPGALRFKRLPDEVEISTGKHYFDWKVTRPNDTVETWLNNKLFFVE